MRVLWLLRVRVITRSLNKVAPARKTCKEVAVNYGESAIPSISRAFVDITLLLQAVFLLALFISEALICKCILLLLQLLYV